MHYLQKKQYSYKYVEKTKASEEFSKVANKHKNNIETVETFHFLY